FAVGSSHFHGPTFDRIRAVDRAASKYSCNLCPEDQLFHVHKCSRGRARRTSGIGAALGGAAAGKSRADEAPQCHSPDRLSKAGRSKLVATLPSICPARPSESPVPCHCLRPVSRSPFMPSRCPS